MFKSNYIQIYEHGIEILHNGIESKHIDYSEIDNYEIKNDFISKNWILLLSIGSLISIISLIWIKEFFSGFTYNKILTSGFGQSGYMILVSPIILLVIGVGFIISSFRKSQTLIISIKYKRIKIRLKEFEKENQIESINEFLKERII